MTTRTAQGLPADDLPPVTDVQLRTAFAKLRLHGTTFEAAMADPKRSRIVTACAAQLRRAEWEATHQRTVEPVRRCILGADGHPVKWTTQMVPSTWVRPATPDLFNKQPQQNRD